MAPPIKNHCCNANHFCSSTWDRADGVVCDSRPWCVSRRLLAWKHYCQRTPDVFDQAKCFYSWNQICWWIEQELTSRMRRQTVCSCIVGAWNMLHLNSEQMMFEKPTQSACASSSGIMKLFRVFVSFQEIFVISRYKVT